MVLIKQNDEFVVDTEEEAKALIEKARKDSHTEGYVLGANGYTYKTKKAKGEIIGEVWVCKITKVLGGVWDDYE